MSGYEGQDLESRDTSAHLAKLPSLAEVKREKSIQQIKEDKSILHPKKQMLRDNLKKFIEEFVKKELMARAAQQFKQSEEEQSNTDQDENGQDSGAGLKTFNNSLGF